MPKNIFNMLSIIVVTLLALGGCATSSQFTGLGQRYQVPLTNEANSELSNSAFWQGSPQTIWSRLQPISIKKLEPAYASQPTSVQGAWLKLAIISKRYNKNSKQLIQELMIWRNENPSHPGNTLFNNNGTLANLTTTSLPKHIALLLPMQGPMATNGKAVRDGFLSAYYQSLAKTNVKQVISFYDTSSNPNIGALYQQAVSQGADVVVGPLIKEDVQRLLSSSQINVPTLALNYSQGTLPSNFYEFGLSPVHEVQQVADKARQAGLGRAIIIVPEGAWGQSISKNLIAHWQSQGGRVSDIFYYQKRMNFDLAIANLLHINPTADREKSREINDKTILEAQRRHDFDVIFLLAEPQAARQIVPLIKYYYAEKIPIYATSVIYSGSPNPQKDSDLNGVIFADIPWVIKSSQNTTRLYAVGRDAYVISGELQRLKDLPHFPIYAATGALTLTSSHQIHRRLPWTKMQNGHP